MSYNSSLEYKVNNGEYYKISKQTMEFILSYEGFQKYPYIPISENKVIGDSGITIGYGYDLGQQSKTQIATDLQGLYTEDEIKRFQSVSGLKTHNAINNLYKVNDIQISKENALKLSSISKKRYAQDTYDIYPEVINLHPHCQGALLSIIYNRGNSLNGERRIEMRNIQIHLKNMKYEKISNEIISMKRLWTDGGLLSRREKEAEFFKKGLDCGCYK